MLRNIGINIGTQTTQITISDKKLVYSEPTSVAIDNSKKKIIAIGNKAKKMEGRTTKTISVINPVESGVISNFSILNEMLVRIFKSLKNKYKISKTQVFIGINCGNNEVQAKAIEEIAMSLKLKEVSLINNLVAGALQAQLDIFEPNGNMVIDIGSGATRIGIISLGTIVYSNTIKIGGDTLDEQIVQYIKKEKKVLIAKETAKDIKEDISSAISLISNKEAICIGKDIENGIPRIVKINTSDVLKAIGPKIDEIIDLIKYTIENAPNELITDIIDNGIVLIGGGANIKNLDKLIFEKTGAYVKVADNPELASILGLCKISEKPSKFTELMLTTRKRI